MPDMCSTSMYDLEEVPLDDDDPNSLEFKILAFYVRHHVFKNTPDVFSPKLLRTRSLSQKGLTSWSTNESWTQVPWPTRHCGPSEKPVNLAKKKSSWRTFFGVLEKEEESQSLPTVAHTQGPRTMEFQGLTNQQWPRSLSNVEQRVEHAVEDPKAASIANRVAEIVYSWPPPKLTRLRGGGVTQEAASSQKDGEDQIIARIVELLKYTGDQLAKELKKDKTLISCFPDGLSYSVFKTITDQFLKGVDTRGESEVNAQGFKAALAIDVMAKLTAIDNHPMNRVLGFGTKYLKENFSPWVQLHGGWEKILGISHEEVD
ncbi:apoptosis facilitator Bcl-2-like protein 14 isoform X1 [Tupaia chinensis]|uniref:apoptosis facilitator Bcl-2-like protein 14 isoform X1 n=2 Tax=Tupaia chinensis TaxID=246437 RepID=UPI0003C90EA9|nr:apoptosis facilitator Bcl-2-like protein 14 isoform X1 [Tupaia chinensis]